MIEQAEREGKLAPGGTIVEPTSGNTGVGLAIAAALKGYRCVFVMPDKIAEEKRALLRAYGAEVVICPTAVPPESPESYYSVSNRLAEEIPGAFKPDQYSNQANPQAHYETTGPELWEQTGGEIDATRPLRRHGRDDHRHRALPEGAEARPARRRRRPRGLDLLAARQRPSLPRRGHRRGLLADDLRPVARGRVRDRLRPRLLPDRAPARARGGHPRRRLGRHGRLGDARRWRSASGRRRPSSRSIPDSGRGYLSKVYDDNWLLEHGFLEREAPAATIQAVLAFKRRRGARRCPSSSPSQSHQKVGEAIDLMQRYGISQIPVVRNGDEADSLADVVGSIRESGLLDRVFRRPGRRSTRTSRPRWSRRSPPSRSASPSTPSSPTSPPGTRRSWSPRDGRPVGVLTRADLLEYLARQQSSA